MHSLFWEESAQLNEDERIVLFLESPIIEKLFLFETIKGLFKVYLPEGIKIIAFDDLKLIAYCIASESSFPSFGKAP